MLIQFDAIDYRDLGMMVYKEGWRTFLETGPHREPLYPWMIAVSMRVADAVGVSYEYIQKSLQVGILFLSQLLLIMLMRQAKIRDGIIAATILYFGFSPAIVNSAFSLYSEIAAYPAVLLIIAGAWYGWRAIHYERISRVIAGAVLVALAFVWASFVKAIFQYVFLIFIIPFAIPLIEALFRKNTKKTFKAAVFIGIVSAVFMFPVISYRYANKFFNGNFEFTTRYDQNFFGAVAQRTDPLPPALFWAHLASVPGGGVCRVFFSEEICQDCEFSGMDLRKSTELSVFLKENQVEVLGAERTQKILSRAVEKISRNSLQYFFLTAIETLKMAFWESAQIGFVAYPAPLKHLFDYALFKNGIRFVLALLTYFSLFYLTVRVYRYRSKLFDFGAEEGIRIQTVFFILLLIAIYTVLYALYPILTRFALPIVALYLLCIAFTLETILGKAGKTVPV